MATNQVTCHTVRKSDLPDLKTARAVYHEIWDIVYPIFCPPPHFAVLGGWFDSWNNSTKASGVREILVRIVVFENAKIETAPMLARIAEVLKKLPPETYKMYRHGRIDRIKIFYKSSK